MNIGDYRIGGYNLADRLQLTLGNIRFQDDRVLWDDYEKLEMLLEILRGEMNSESLL